MLDVLLTLFILYFVGFIFFCMGWLGWRAYKDLWPTVYDRRPRSKVRRSRSMATRMTDDEYAIKWQRYEWRNINPKQRANQH